MKITSWRSPDFSVYDSKIPILKPLGFPSFLIHIYYEEKGCFLKSLVIKFKMQLCFSDEREQLAEITVGVHMHMFYIYIKILSLEYESKIFQWCQFR